MQYRGKIVGAAKALLFVLAFLLVFNGVNDTLRLKTYAAYSYPFYQEEQGSIDVVLAGSSHMLNGVLPMQLWQEQGIASYNIAQNAQSMPVTYYAVKDAIDRQHPKLVVVDTYHILFDTLYNEGSLRLLHDTFDNMPTSLTKLLGIHATIEGAKEEEFYLPIELYHGRWKELKKIDFTPVENYTKGAHLNYGVTEYGDFPILAEDDTTEIPAVQLTYLNKLIDLCEGTGTPLLLINLPHYATGENERFQRLANAVAAVAEAKGVPYLNFFHMLDEVPIDFTTDMKDEGHMNPAGAAKVTAYLGQYIMAQYDIADRRDDPAWASWKDAYDRYVSYDASEHLRYTTDLSDYLDLLAKGDFTVALAVKSTPGECMTPALAAKLQALGVTWDLTDQTVMNYLTLLQGGQAVVEKGTRDPDEELSATAMADGTQFQLTSAMFRAGISVAGRAYSRNGTSLNFVVWDNLRHEVVDSVRFNAHDPSYYCERR